VTGSVIAIAAVGVSLVYGILGLVNFAYGDYMAFGALVAVELNGPLGLGIVPSALLAMVATDVLSVALDLALWRPLRARRAGFMSLFLASSGRAARNPSPSRTGLWRPHLRPDLQGLHPSPLVAGRQEDHLQHLHGDRHG
jgi:ABC-type branched-subunit amino acid transport system permease subunit